MAGCGWCNALTRLKGIRGNTVWLYVVCGTRYFSFLGTFRFSTNNLLLPVCGRSLAKSLLPCCHPACFMPLGQIVRELLLSGSLARRRAAVSLALYFRPQFPCIQLTALVSLQAQAFNCFSCFSYFRHRLAACGSLATALAHH